MDSKDCTGQWQSSIARIDVDSQNKTPTGLYVKNAESSLFRDNIFESKKSDINKVVAIANPSTASVETCNVKLTEGQPPRRLTNNDERCKDVSKEEEDEAGCHEDEDFGKTREESGIGKNEVHDGTVQRKEPVRRPMNAFLIFCKRHRSIVRNQNIHLDNRSVTRILGDLWANLAPDDKALYIKLAKEYKEAFMKANPDYKWYNPEKHVVTSVIKPSTRPSNAYTVYHGQQPRTVGAITPGKLADPSCMGGLSLLLMAGQHGQPAESWSDARGHSDSSTVDGESAMVADVSKESTGKDAMTPLLQLAEMCSNRLEVHPANKETLSESLPPIELTTKPMDLSCRPTQPSETTDCEQVLDLTVPSMKFTQLCASSKHHRGVSGQDAKVCQTWRELKVTDGEVRGQSCDMAIETAECDTENVKTLHKTEKKNGREDSHAAGAAIDVTSKQGKVDERAVHAKKVTDDKNVCLRSAAIAACSKTVVDHVVDALYQRSGQDASKSADVHNNKVKINVADANKLQGCVTKIASGLGRHAKLNSGGKSLTVGDIQETLIRQAMKQSLEPVRSGRKTGAATSSGEKKLKRRLAPPRGSITKVEKKSTDPSPITAASSVSLPAINRTSPTTDIYAFTETIDELPPKQRPSQPIKSSNKPSLSSSLTTLTNVFCDKQPLQKGRVVSLMKARDDEVVGGNEEEGKGKKAGDVNKVAKEGNKRKRKKDVSDIETVAKKKLANSSIEKSNVSESLDQSVEQTSSRLSDVIINKTDSGCDLSSPGSSPRSDIVGQDVTEGVRGGSWVRKSQRCNRGNRYKELITQGLIQPSRVNARRYDQSDENTIRTDAVVMAQKRNPRKRAVSETATDDDSLKRYSTGDFDLSACIASLPVCDVKSTTKNMKARSRHNSSDQSVVVRKQANSSLDVNIAELLRITRQPLPSSDVEPAVTTGSRKRKARKFAIIHLRQSSAPLEGRPAVKGTEAAATVNAMPQSADQPKHQPTAENNNNIDSSPVTEDLPPLTTIISGCIGLTSLADDSSHDHRASTPVISAPTALTSHCQLTPMVAHSSDTLVTL